MDEAGAADGLLLIDKPEGWTSRETDNYLRRLLHVRKLGHAGTLDPLATGLLPVLFGQATRLAPVLFSGAKTYRAVLKLGEQTSTLDRAGPIIATKSFSHVTGLAVAAVLPGFLGQRLQKPPAYSAKKVAGRRAYALARAGQTPNLAPQPVTIERLELLRFDLPEVEIEVECSTGTYIRVLAEELAVALGTVGHLAALRRLKSGDFTIAQALSLGGADEENLRAARASIISLAGAAAALPPVDGLTPELAAAVLHGVALPLPAPADGSGFHRVNDPLTGRLLAVVLPGQGRWRYQCVFGGAGDAGQPAAAAQPFLKS